MSSADTRPRGTRRHRIRVALQLALAAGLLVLGVGNLTDTITWTLPPAVYLLAAVALFAYGVDQMRRG